jgi:hypothetical protein
VLSDATMPLVAPGNRLFFYRDGQLLVSEFDLATLKISGSPEQVLESVPFANPTQTKPCAQTPAYEGGRGLSSDGKWLANVSNESGRNQVYVRSFPDGDQRLQVSTDGGTQPAVSANGREIFYRNGDRMTAVESRTTGAGIELSQRKLLFEKAYSYGAGITIANNDVRADGQRFLMVKDEDNVGRLRVVLNWRPDTTR